MQPMSMSEEMAILELMHEEVCPVEQDEEKQADISRSESFESSNHPATFHSYRSATYHSDKSPSDLSEKSAVSLGPRRSIVDPSATAKSEHGSPQNISTVMSISAPCVSADHMLVAPPAIAGICNSAKSADNVNDVATADTVSSSNDTGGSRFDSERHCRYCYSYLSAEKNSSACSCSGLLCRECLQKELLISWNRALNHNQWDNRNRRLNQLVPSLKCTVCKFQYPVTRSKLDIELSWRKYVRYFFKKTFPKRSERDMTVFDGFHHGAFNSLYLLPIDTAHPIVIMIGLWIGFTLLVEGVGGYKITDGRIMCFLFDSYLLVEVSRVTEYLDFPERIWVSILYLIRSFIFCAWAIRARWTEQQNFGAMLMDPNVESDPDVIGDDPLNAHVNWRWLAVLVLFTWIVCGYEIHQYCRAILRRALRDEKDQIRVSITSKSGTEYHFTLPNPHGAGNLFAAQLREGAPDRHRPDNAVVDIMAPPQVVHLHALPVIRAQAEGI